MPTLFVAKETAPGESRVASVPEAVSSYAAIGLSVLVEAGAGTAAGFPDDAYRTAGAELVKDAAAGLTKADLAVGIRPPQDAEQAVQRLRAGSILLCSMHPLRHQELVNSLAERQITAFALDLVPRTARAQAMDVLSSQATVAGHQAALVAAAALPRFFPMLVTAAGTVSPARVLVLGAGVAGLQAIATSRRLGAIVEANDVRRAARDDVQSLGARFVDTGTPPEAQGEGGYAEETGAEYRRNQQLVLAARVAQADVVIASAELPGRRAPVLVSDAMLRRMRPGSVVVDLAAQSGGNVEGSSPGRRVLRHGVLVIGDTDLASQKGHDASRMFSRNLREFVGLLVDGARLRTEFDDEILRATLVTHRGQVVHAATAAALALDQRGVTR